MERNFYNEDFEDLIRQKASQYKMYPSDKVWKNINSSLHTRKRWFIAGMFTLITGILFFAGKELLTPATHIAINKKTIDNTGKNINNSSSPVSDNENGDDNNAAEISIAPAFVDFNTAGLPEKKKPEVIAVAQTDPLANIIAPPSLAEVQLPDLVVSDIFDENDITSDDKQYNKFYTGRSVLTQIGKKSIAVIENNVPEHINPDQKTVQAYSAAMEADKNQMDIVENIAPFGLISPKKQNRKYWQLYITPTFTYRTLSGAAFAAAKSNIQNVPIASTSQDANPNLYANNKPAIGFEIGSDILYRFTRNLSFKAGLQFNYSRYTINAYVSNPQPAIIALNAFNGYPGNTITAYTNIGTVGGKATVNLQNQYFQLSIPLGFEMRVIGNEKLQLNIGATVQPSYLLNRDSYLLTSDFANYTQEPSLFRRWNVNGSVEAFISYKTGKIRWQVGPQFRYQLLSTYTSDYPINENLKGLGIKFGISKTIW
ncbi:MAG TPA: outer membrane beta-barrel protein [Puia sp.]|nr:outer membrane beta-barrel protein [Puia sp.]